MAVDWMILFLIMACIAAVVIVLWLREPDSMRAHFSDELLSMANLSLEYLKDGMTPEAARSICKLLLPATNAMSVAITDKEVILAFEGFREEQNPTGTAITTEATLKTIADGQMRVLRTSEDIGFPVTDKHIQAAIIVPLVVGSGDTESSVKGALKFYYRRPSRITKTQRSIAEGFGTLLSTQMTAHEMENQRQIASNMELKMLQSQINPHFLFNTINTIASMVRTDPPRARDLLRDFASFYRGTLENSSDRISLAREIEQTQRYFSLLLARFGDDRVGMEVDLDPTLATLLVPPFLVQPLVENAIKHAMPSEGKLMVSVTCTTEADDVVIIVEDDGIGMDISRLSKAMDNSSGSGLGIALPNVQERLKGTYGPRAGLELTSCPGRGTIVKLRLAGAVLQLAAAHEDQEAIA